MVWLGAPAHRASKGVRLLPGEYALESENDDYWYFQGSHVVFLYKGQPVE